ncbi:Hypothetical predicted protein [Olea europaea subsp. europaea]|uniref:Uncharacterized protein n=1 Tax=Olea europaea subsp. europaea TaxID=158383 RepID=A0A8S0U0G2_OLEEU|nr:Hypothetical predicted protein [Olea europaea subsp. europaea]
MFNSTRYCYQQLGVNVSSKIELPSFQNPDVPGDFTCTSEVQREMPYLKTAYGDSICRVLHVGPDTCSVCAFLILSSLYHIRLNHSPVVVISDAVDYPSSKYLKKTIPDLARVSSTSLVIFTGISRAKVPELSKFGRQAKMRSSSWWGKFFVLTSLDENEAARKKFEQSATKSSHTPSLRCQIFHLKSYG